MRIIMLLLMTLSLYAAYVQKGTTQYPVTIEGQEGHEYYRGYSLDYGIFASSHEFNPKKGIELLEIAVNKGDVLAMYDMSVLYETGTYEKDADKVKSQKLINKALAGIKVLSQAGNPRATAVLGNIYNDGVDKAKAIDLYKKSVQDGSILGLYALGECYRSNDTCGVKKDMDKALSYYKDASSKGYRQASSMVAYMYYRADGNIEYDEGKIIEYLKKADGEVSSLNYYAYFYNYKKEYKKAFKYYTKSINLGSGDAYFYLAQRWYFEDKYNQGKKDLKKAKLYFIEAKRRGISGTDEYLSQLKSESETLYADLIYYKGMQTKEKISLINKKPIYTKNFEGIKISDDAKKFIIGNKVYSVNPFKLIYEAKQKNIKVLDFYKNDYLFIVTRKGYGLYSFRDKKFKYKFSYHGKSQSVRYSNGILRYLFKDKKGKVNNYKNYYNIKLDNIYKREIKYPYSYINDKSYIYVNNSQTYAVIFVPAYDQIGYGDSPTTRFNSQAYTLNLKTGKEERVTRLYDKCHSDDIRFISNNTFRCGQYITEIPSLQTTYIGSEYILDRERVLYYDYSKMYIRDIKSSKILNEVKFSSSISTNHTIVSKNKNLMITKAESKGLYNIYNTVNFFGSKSAKFVNKVLLEVAKSKIGLEEAFEKVFNSQNIHLKASDFVQNKNIVIVEVNIEGFGSFGTLTFKAEDIVKSLAEKYTLKNTKFQIQNGDIKLIAADLYPIDSGYILSYGRVPPAYAQSLNNFKLKYKLSVKDEKKVTKANKMYMATLFDEAEIIYNAIAEKNPIGFDSGNRINKIVHEGLLTVDSDHIADYFGLSDRIYTKTKVNVIKELEKQKKMILALDIIDTNDIELEGALIQKIALKNSGLHVGDVIVSIDSNIVKRASDVDEILNSLENDSTLELEVLRDKTKMKFNIEVKSTFMYPNELLKYYRLYILRAMATENPKMAQEAYAQLQSRISSGSLLVNKVNKEINLLLKALILIENDKEKEAFKQLFAYDEKFEEKSIEQLTKRVNYGWLPLLKHKKKLAILFDLPSKQFKPDQCITVKHNIYDINGNLVKVENQKKPVKKKLQPSSKKGGVLE